MPFDTMNERPREGGVRPLRTEISDEQAPLQALDKRIKAWAKKSPLKNVDGFLLHKFQQAEDRLIKLEQEKADREEALKEAHRSVERATDTVDRNQRDALRLSLGEDPFAFTPEDIRSLRNQVQILLIKKQFQKRELSDDERALAWAAIYHPALRDSLVLTETQRPFLHAVASECPRERQTPQDITNIFLARRKERREAGWRSAEDELNMFGTDLEKKKEEFRIFMKEYRTQKDLAEGWMQASLEQINMRDQQGTAFQLPEEWVTDWNDFAARDRERIVKRVHDLLGAYNGRHIAIINQVGDLAFLYQTREQWDWQTALTSSEQERFATLAREDAQLFVSMSSRRGSRAS